MTRAITREHQRRVRHRPDHQDGRLDGALPGQAALDERRRSTKATTARSSWPLAGGSTTVTFTGIGTIPPQNARRHRAVRERRRDQSIFNDDAARARAGEHGHRAAQRHQDLRYALARQRSQGLSRSHRMMTNSHSRLRHAPARATAQHGSFLLEALIAVLIVALAVLGLLGLMARGDAGRRREQACAAKPPCWLRATSARCGWTTARSPTCRPSTRPAAPPTTTWQAMVAQTPAQRQLFRRRRASAGATANSADVEIEIRWTPPGLKTADVAAGLAPLPGVRHHRSEQLMGARVTFGRRAQRGAGLVETMVGILIGLRRRPGHLQHALGGRELQAHGRRARPTRRSPACSASSWSAARRRNGGNGISISAPDLMTCDVAKASNVWPYVAGGGTPALWRPIPVLVQDGGANDVSDSFITLVQRLAARRVAGRRSPPMPRRAQPFIVQSPNGFTSPSPAATPYLDRSRSTRTRVTARRSRSPQRRPPDPVRPRHADPQRRRGDLRGHHRPGAPSW